MTTSHLDPPRPNGHDRRTTPLFSTAEDVNPPQPGDPGFDDHAEHRSEWRHGIAHAAVESPDVEVRPTPYYDARLSRLVTVGDPALEARLAAIEAAVEPPRGLPVPERREELA